MPKKKRGIYADVAGTSKANLEDKVADFSYESDVLAQLIVEIWLGQHTDLTTPSGAGTTHAQYRAREAAAKAVLAARGIYLDHPIVITEDEYDDGFHLADAGLMEQTRCHHESHGGQPRDVQLAAVSVRTALGGGGTL